MYMPPAFEEKDPAVLWEIVRSHPLGLLVSMESEGLLANAIPFEVSLDGENALLLAHMAKGNGQWQSLDGQQVLAVFQGANSYVSPQWYASKKEHGRVVPTWNYAMVQVRGRARVIEDREWLLSQVSRLTNHHEGSVTQGQAWKVGDAPDDFIAAQLKGIVGLSVEVTSIVGKLKASQNRPASDKAGVVTGLAASGDAQSQKMAALVQRSLRQTALLRPPVDGEA